MLITYSCRSLYLQTIYAFLWKAIVIRKKSYVDGKTKSNLQFPNEGVYEVWSYRYTVDLFETIVVQTFVVILWFLSRWSDWNTKYRAKFSQITISLPQKLSNNVISYAPLIVIFVWTSPPTLSHEGGRTI